jgi:glycosyltransferase involved in cell wall biosynthesis
MVRTKPFFCVVIPMFNEQAGVIRCVDAISTALHRLPVASAVIVVQDGSTDQTGLLLKQLQSRCDDLCVVTHEKNMGYGQALVSGTRRATEMGAEYVLFMDSDLTNDPADIPKFLTEMKKGTDAIKATRYSLGGGARGVPWFRLFISKYGNRLARILMKLPISDPTNGFRAIKANLLQKADFKETAFPIIMEELFFLKKHNAILSEVPVVLTNRSNSLKGSSFRYKPHVFWNYLKYPLYYFTNSYRFFL